MHSWSSKCAWSMLEYALIARCISYSKIRVRWSTVWDALNMPKYSMNKFQLFWICFGSLWYSCVESEYILSTLEHVLYSDFSKLHFASTARLSILKYIEYDRTCSKNFAVSWKDACSICWIYLSTAWACFEHEFEVYSKHESTEGMVRASSVRAHKYL